MVLFNILNELIELRSHQSDLTWVDSLWKMLNVGVYVRSRGYWSAQRKVNIWPNCIDTCDDKHVIIIRICSVDDKLIQILVCCWTWFIINVWSLQQDTPSSSKDLILMVHWVSWDGLNHYLNIFIMIYFLFYYVSLISYSSCRAHLFPFDFLSWW